MSCLVSSCFFVTVSPPSWTTQEQLQSGITMASVNRIDSNFFLWLRVCLLYVGDNMLRAPHARGHVHVPFYEGTCPTKSHFFMNNSGTTSKWNYDGFRYPNRLKFFCVTPCGQHATCPTYIWAHAVLWRHVPKKSKKTYLPQFFCRKKIKQQNLG